MPIREQLNKDLRESQLKRDELRTSVLRLLMAGLNNREIEKRTKLAKTEPVEKLADLSRLNDEEVMEVIVSEAKKRRESIELFVRGNRHDLADKEKKELSLLENYLPAQFSEEELKKIVAEAVSASKAKQMADLGKVMSLLMPKVKNRADGNLISRLVREKLS
ncbi:MAG: GatB/YqeY domain-containing protein [bacterium]|nr:GatB/YqeY domain-containing protein [bacterium]